MLADSVNAALVSLNVVLFVCAFRANVACKLPARQRWRRFIAERISSSAQSRSHSVIVSRSQGYATYAAGLHG